MCLRLNPGSRRLRLYAGLRRRTARPRRENHDDLRRHFPIADCRGRPRGVQRHSGKINRGTAQQNYDPQLKDLLAKLAEGTKQLKHAIAFVKHHGKEYMDLYGRPLVDIAVALVCGYLFCGQASSNADLQIKSAAEDGSNGELISMNARKAGVARRYITKNAAKIAALSALICTGDKSTFDEYKTFVGQVPAEKPAYA